MKEHGFYVLDNAYVELVNMLGGKYLDTKERPLYCCIQDIHVKALYWAIPTSDLSHRTPTQIERIKNFCSLPKKDIRSAFYHIGTTNKPAIFKISSCLPVTDKYIEKEYTSKGSHLVLADESQIITIQKKLYQILAYEGRFPNKLEQKITLVKSHLISELELNQSIDQSQQATSLHDRMQSARAKCDVQNVRATPYHNNDKSL